MNFFSFIKEYFLIFLIFLLYGRNLVRPQMSGPQKSHHHGIALFKILAEKEYQGKMQPMQRCAAVGLFSAGPGKIEPPKVEGGPVWRGPSKYVRISRHCQFIESETAGEVKCVQPLEEEGMYLK